MSNSLLADRMVSCVTRHLVLVNEPVLVMPKIKSAEIFECDPALIRILMCDLRSEMLSKQCFAGCIITANYLFMLSGVSCLHVTLRLHARTQTRLYSSLCVSQWQICIHTPTLFPCLYAVCSAFYHQASHLWYALIDINLLEIML